MLETLTARELAALYDADAEFALVDTRPAGSYDAWHAPGAIHFPFGPTETLDGRLTELRGLVGDVHRLITICGKGISSGTLGAELVRVTDEFDVAAVEGGMRAWSRVYHRVPVDVGGDDGPIVVQVQRRAKGCLGYLLGDPDAGAAVVVDATADVEQFLLAAGERGLRIEGVLDTHVHADHVSGGRELADRLGVPYYLGEGAADRDVTVPYEPLADGDVLPVGDRELRAIHTPGHTSDMLAFVFDDRAVLTADTLHAAAPGRTELEFAEGDRGARLLYASLHERLLSLPAELVVLPGHVGVSTDGRFDTGAPGEPIATTIGVARELPALELDEDAFVDRLADAGAKPANYGWIIEINRGVREADDRVELELGPNNCSA